MSTYTGLYPLLGERHPLASRERSTWAAALLVAASLHLVAALVRPASHPRGDLALPDGDREVSVVLDRSVTILAPANPKGYRVIRSEDAARLAAGIPVPTFDALVGDVEWGLERVMPDDGVLEAETMFGEGEIVEFGRAAGNGGPLEFEAVEEAPRLIRMEAPAYPELARAAEIEGVVLLRVRVGIDGRVREVTVLLGNQLLRDAAISAAWKAIFRPALQQHHPVEVWIEMPLRFSLR